MYDDNQTLATLTHPAIVADTGAQWHSRWPCTVEGRRTVTFAPGTPDDVIDAFAAQMRQTLFGQEQRVTREGLTLSAYCFCDSSG